MSYIRYPVWIVMHPYVGQMKRKLKTRLNKHIKNIRLDPQKYSVISDHISKHNHSMNWMLKC